MTPVIGGMPTIIGDCLSGIDGTTGGDRQQVAELVRPVRGERSRSAGDRRGEPGAVGHEGVELAVLAAGVDPLRQIAQEVEVERPAGEGGGEAGGVHGDQEGPEAALDELPCQLGRRLLPEREERLHPQAGRRQALLAELADVLKKEIAEGDVANASLSVGGQGLRHPFLVDRIARPGRQGDGGERQAQRLDLLEEKIAPYAMDMDPVAPLGHRGEKTDRGEERRAAQLVQGKGAVLAAAPGEENGGAGVHGQVYPRRRSNSNQRKNGPPKSAVITPTGNSAGAITTRAPASQRARKAPPPRRQAGARAKWSCPAARRSMWGTMRPTKPIGPTMATMAPIIAEVTRRTSRRSRPRSTPRLAASSSPVRRRFRSQRRARRKMLPPSTQGRSQSTSR